MRVMHLIQCGPTTGGTVSHVSTQVAHQVRLGLQVAVVAASDGVATERCRAAGADVFVDPTLGVDGGGDGSRLLDCGRRWRPDLVHAHLMHAGFRALELSEAIGVPAVYTQHMYTVIDPLIRTARAAERALPVIAVSRIAERELSEFRGSSAPVYFVPNGVDIPAASGVRRRESAGPAIGYCGRLSPEKGADLAILALAELQRTVPDATLHVIGTGPDQALLHRMVGALGLGESVQFYGSVSGALTAGFGLDALVVPSRGEAAGLTVLEAMACRIPIVATRVGGIPELVRDGVDGVLVRPDDPGALAAGIAGVLRPEVGGRLAACAHERYREHYRAQTMAERTLAVYESVLAWSRHRTEAGARVVGR